MRPTPAPVRAVFERQYGVIARGQALACGMTPHQVTRAVDGGAWQRVHPGVYRLCGSPPVPLGTLLAACLATGGLASHQSAAWLWGLLPEPPPQPTVSVAASDSRRRPGVVIHRMGDLHPWPAPTWLRVPCTAPPRTVLDLAVVAGRRHLDEAVDRGLALGRFTLPGLTAEINCHARQGRSGVRILRRALAERGYTGAPQPSVLESRVLRLLARGGIRPRGVEVEVVGANGLYRLDITLAAGLAMEVDGFAYHADPEAMTRDHRRRNELAHLGWTVLVFTWLDVTRDGDRVLSSVRHALAAHLASRDDGQQRPIAPSEAPGGRATRDTGEHAEHLIVEQPVGAHP